MAVTPQCSPRPRAANLRLRAAFHESLGAVPSAGPWYALPFISGGISAPREQVADATLSRNPGDPMKGRKTGEGNFTVPVKARSFGVWLCGLFGPPTTTPARAFGLFCLDALPKSGDTLSVGGVAFEWISSGTPTATQIMIGATPEASAAAAATVLNASAAPAVAAATYTAVGPRLEVEHDAAGAGGDAFALAVKGFYARVSAATLKGGALYKHVWRSGATCLPALYLAEEASDLPDGQEKFFGHRGVFVESVNLAFGGTGEQQAEIQLRHIDDDAGSIAPPGGLTLDLTLTANPAANAAQTIAGTVFTFKVAAPAAPGDVQIGADAAASAANLAARVRAHASLTAYAAFAVGARIVVYRLDGAAVVWEDRGLSASDAALIVDSACAADIASGSIAVANGLEAYYGMSCCGLDGGAATEIDPGKVAASFAAEARWSSGGLFAKAKAGTPVMVRLMHANWQTGERLTADIPRTFLPEPRRQLQGPTAISVSYAGVAAASKAVGDGGAAAIFTLVNEQASY